MSDISSILKDISSILKVNTLIALLNLNIPFSVKKKIIHKILNELNISLSKEELEELESVFKSMTANTMYHICTGTVTKLLSENNKDEKGEKE